MRRAGSSAAGAVFVLALMMGASVAGLLVALATPVAAAASLLMLLVCVVLLGAFQRTGAGLSETNQRRYVWLLLAISVAWPTYIALQLPGAPRLDPRRLVALGTLLALIYLFVGRATIRARAANLPVAARLALILLVLMTVQRLASVVWSTPAGAAAAAFFWEFAGYSAVFLFALLVLDSTSSRQALSQAMFVTALLCALLAVLEFVFKRNLLTDLLLRFGNDPEVMVAMGLSRIRDGLLRAQGPFEHPLLLAEFGSAVFCLALARILFARQAGGQSALAWIGLVASLLCMVLSFSRSALACAGLGGLWLGLVWLMRSRRGTARLPGVKVAVMMIALVLAVGMAWSVGQTYVSGQTKEQSESSTARAYMLERGIAALEVQPLKGFGIGAAGELAGVHGRARVLTLDNYLLTVALESGLPYAFTLVTLWLTAVWAASRRALSGGSEVAFLAGAAALLLAMLTMRTVLAINYNLPLVYLVAGLCFPASAPPLAPPRGAQP